MSLNAHLECFSNLMKIILIWFPFVIKVRACFYIFLNVQNLVAISACWARCGLKHSGHSSSPWAFFNADILIKPQQSPILFACRCADVFSSEAASRLFGFISAGVGGVGGVECVEGIRQNMELWVWTWLGRLHSYPSTLPGATVGQLMGSLTTAVVATSAKGKGVEGTPPLFGLIFASSMLMYAAAFLSARIQRPGGGELPHGKGRWFPLA